MTKPTKFVARFGGKVVGSRKSPRPYAFAVVLQYDEAAYRAAAYEYSPTRDDRSNFDYYTVCASLQPGDTYPGFNFEVGEDAHTTGKAKIEGGWDAYVARCRDRAVESFEALRAKGHFEPHVSGWSMSRANAEKMAAQHGQYRHARILAIVTAEPATA